MAEPRPEGRTGRSGRKARRGMPHDGRVAKGARTRAAMVEATIALIESGNPRPTGQQVAAEAGVSVRLLFHHFEGVQTLFLDAAELQSARTRSLIGIIPPHGPVGLRVAAICHQRRQLFETIAPVLRATLARTGNRTDPLADRRALLRHQLAVGLRPEILARGRSAPVLLESLDVAAGWQSWTSLRVEAGLSATEAERVMAYTVAGLLH
jgi:TetR/AcrR family transcriptional regulator, regulator of autoinduction and epiphytic fitness